MFKLRCIDCDGTGTGELKCSSRVCPKCRGKMTFFKCDECNGAIHDCKKLSCRRCKGKGYI